MGHSTKFVILLYINMTLTSYTKLISYLYYKYISILLYIYKIIFLFAFNYRWNKNGKGIYYKCLYIEIESV